MKTRAWMLAGLLVPWLLMACCSESLAAQPWKILAGKSRAYPAIDDTITPQAGLSAAAQAGGVQGMGFTAESTAVFSSGLYSDVIVLLRAIPVQGDTTSIVRLAVCAKVFAWDFNAPLDSAGAHIIPDSLAFGFQTVDRLNGLDESRRPPPGSGAGLYPGEIEVVIHPWDGRDGKSNDAFGLTGTALHLNQILGIPNLSGGLMQVRVRLLAYGTTASKPRIQAWVMGF